jgi:tRNA dimethylallyltransferase
MSQKKTPVIVILGPTGIGKSDLGIRLAELIGGEIISGDSMQVYRGMDIGTGKVTPIEQEQVVHHLIDIKNPDEEYSVADFCIEADKLIRQITERGKVPIIVGGTGLYLQALIEGYEFSSVPENKEFRNQLEERALDNSKELYEELRKKDPEIAKEIEPENVRRVIRALENLEFGQSLSRKKAASPPYDHWIIGLTGPREFMYDRINQRVDLMIKAGWAEECADLIGKSIDFSKNALQAIGYKEIFECIKNNHVIDSMIIEKIKQRTRNFAKRQVTWFKRMDYIHWIEIDQKTEGSKILTDLVFYWENNYKKR